MKDNIFIQKLIIGLIILSGGILLFQFAFYFYHFCINLGYCSLSGDTATWGQFGDFFGGTLNPLLTFFTFIILVVTFNQQRKELFYQYNQSAIDQLARTIELLVNEYDGYLKKYIHENMVELQNNYNNSYPIIFDVRHMIGDVFLYLKKIEKLEPVSPLIFYYKRKLFKYVDLLSNKGYLTEDNPEQKEMLRFFRDNSIK